MISDAGVPMSLTELFVDSRHGSLARTALLAIALSTGLSACDRFISTDSRVERAQAHYAKGAYRPAMSELKVALQKEPGHAIARLELAKLSLALGDLASADKELARAADAGANPSAVRTLRYQVLFDRGDAEGVKRLLAEDTTLAPERRALFEARVALIERDPARARLALDAALAAAPDDPEALLDSARLAASEGQTEAGMKLPDRLQGVPEFHARALYLRAALEMGLGTYREARDTLQLAQSEGKTLRVPEQIAIAMAQTEVDLALNDPAAAEHSIAGVDQWARGSVVSHYLRARIALSKRDFPGAVAECQRVLAIDPQHVQAQLLLASAHISSGSLEQAQDTLTRLLAAKPDIVTARKLLAQVHLGRNEPENARKVLADVAAADADTAWLLGTALLHSGSTTTAVEHLERALAANPTDAARSIDLASIYISSNAADKAIALLEGIPAESPHAPRAKILTVLAAAAGKPRAEARREIAQLAARHPNDAGLLVAAGSVLGSSGDFEGARRLLAQALALEPKRIETRLAVARLNVSERNLDAAQSDLLEVLKIDSANQPAHLALAEISWTRADRAGSRKWLEDAIKADPASIDARLRLAQVSFIEGDGGRARSLLDQVLAVSKDRKSALTSTGRVLAQAGMSDEALARFKEAAAAGSREANLDTARVHLGLDDLSSARTAVNAALAANPQSREARKLMIAIDARDGQVERAFEQARNLNPTASPASLATLRGDLQGMARDFAAAAASYESAQRLEPTAQGAIKLFEARRVAKVDAPERSLTQWLERSAQDADVRRVLGLYYETVGQTDRAVAEYEKLVAADAADPSVLNNLAWSLHQKGDPRAQELARKAYERAPQQPEIADTYGWILVRMDKVSEGLPVLQSALAKQSRNPDIQYHAAVAYSRTGDAPRAKALLAEALKSGENFTSRPEAEQLLRSMGSE